MADPSAALDAAIAAGPTAISEGDLDAILQRAAEPDTPGGPELPEGNFDYDEWLNRLAPSTQTQAMLPATAPPPAQDPQIMVFAPAAAPPRPIPQPQPPPPQPPQPAVVDISDDALKAQIEQVQAALDLERESRRTQQQALASAHRQLEFASNALSRANDENAKLEKRLDGLNAAEQAQRLELRDEHQRSSRDGAVIRSLQQREASLLAQLSGVIHERDAATAAAKAHQSDAEAVRSEFTEMQRAVQEERRSAQRLRHENATLRQQLEAARSVVEAAEAKAESARALAAKAARATPPQPFFPPQPPEYQAPPPQPQQPPPQPNPASPNYPRVVSYCTPAVPSSPPGALPPPPPPMPEGVPQPEVPRAAVPLPTTAVPQQQAPPSAKRSLASEFTLPPEALQMPPPLVPGPYGTCGKHHPEVAMAPHTAGLRAAERHAKARATRRGNPHEQKPHSFNLFSGAPLQEPAGQRSPPRDLVWKNGVAYIAPTTRAAPPPPPPAALAPAPPPAAPAPAPQPAPQYAPPPLYQPGAVDSNTSVMPFAVDDDLSRRATAAITPIERELSQLSQQKDRLEAEYARMPLTAGRTAAERRSKQLCEERLDEIAKRMSTLRLQLKNLQPMRR